MIDKQNGAGDARFNHDQGASLEGREKKESWLGLGARSRRKQVSSFFLPTTGPRAPPSSSSPRLPCRPPSGRPGGCRPPPSLPAPRPPAERAAWPRPRPARRRCVKNEKEEKKGGEARTRARGWGWAWRQCTRPPCRRHVAPPGHTTHVCVAVPRAGARRGARMQGLLRRRPPPAAVADPPSSQFQTDRVGRPGPDRRRDRVELLREGAGQLGHGPHHPVSEAKGAGGKRETEAEREGGAVSGKTKQKLGAHATRDPALPHPTSPLSPSPPPPPPKRPRRPGQDRRPAHPGLLHPAPPRLPARRLAGGHQEPEPGARMAAGG